MQYYAILLNILYSTLYLILYYNSYFGWLVTAILLCIFSIPPIYRIFAITFSLIRVTKYHRKADPIAVIVPHAIVTSL